MSATNAVIFDSGKFQGIGNDGQVVPYGKLYFNKCCTGDAVDTYRDSVLSSKNTHPVILSASGKADVFILDDIYDIRLEDKNGTTVWTISNFVPALGKGEGFYETFYPPESVDGYMYNPVTGIAMDIVQEIIVFMLDVGCREYGWYTSSFNSMNDFNDIAFPQDCIVKIIRGDDDIFQMKVEGGIFKDFYELSVVVPMTQTPLTHFAKVSPVCIADNRKALEIRALTADEKLVATDLKGLIKAFKWDNPQGEEDLTIHVGIFSQDIITAFTNHGLDVNDYGMFTYSGIDNEDIYGVRYNELLAFIISAI